jgi:hypothetical protein
MTAGATLWPVPDCKGDPLGDPVQAQIEALPAAKGYLVCPLAWLARVWPTVRVPAHLAVAQMIYRECCLQRRQTVSLPNGALRALGVSRYAKYRALAALGAAGAITAEARNGRSVRVTLHWFP